jgi:hypothetical protein
MPRLAPVRSIVRRGWLEEVGMNRSLTIRKGSVYHNGCVSGARFMHADVEMAHLKLE